MVALQSRIMLVRIGEEARRVRNIEFPSCLIASRRDTIACVADAYSYSLLDVEHQQKIPLFPISSSSEVFDSGHVEDIPRSSETSAKRLSAASFQNPESEDAGGHSRDSSLNAFLGSRQPSPQPGQRGRSRSRTPDLSSASGTPRQSISQERHKTNTSKDLPEPPARESEPAASDKHKPLPPTPKPKPSQLKPHIASPTPSEFLLVTGTEPSEPGVGMFVNVDGDVVRGTMDFQRYPEAVVIDGSQETNQARSSDDTEEGYVLAVVAVDDDGKTRKCIEVQRWDVDPGATERQKAYVEIPITEDMQKAQVGIRHTVSPSQLEFHELQELLRMVRLRTPPLNPPDNHDPRTQESIEQLQKENELFEPQEMTEKGTSPAGWEVERNKEEAAFVRGLGNIRSSLIMWSGDRIWRVLRNPLTLQLDHVLQKAQAPEDSSYKSIDRESIVRLTQSIRDAEPKTEAEFLGLNYVRQKASLLLFVNLISTPPGARNEVTTKSTEEALVNSSLDPRVVLLLIPLLRVEVLQGPQGIWVHAGLARVAESYIQQSGDPSAGGRTPPLVDRPVLDMIKRYLFSWQRKRGYGSITDETFVFDSVDAALLHLLLEQDAQGLRESHPSATVRAELNRLVDNWKGNFDRAVMLLEGYNRLFVLSRLYQSRKMCGNVLKTWRRIADGEKDVGDEVTAAGVEVQMRRYLVKIRDVQLIEEYGSWLAARNPSLGVQVFADDSSRVKLEPAEVVALLKQRAPNAVQSYLEYLVFSKNVSIHILMTWKHKTNKVLVPVFPIRRRPHCALPGHRDLCPPVFPRCPLISF